MKYQIILFKFIILLNSISGLFISNISLKSIVSLNNKKNNLILYNNKINFNKDKNKDKNISFIYKKNHNKLNNYEKIYNNSIFIICLLYYLLFIYFEFKYLI